MDGESFQAELVRLIRAAEADGVDVEGGWSCDGDAGLPEWGIEIYEVVSRNRMADSSTGDS